MKDSVAYVWGTDAEERGRVFPCDGFVDALGCGGKLGSYYRGVSVRGRAEVVFAWLCQLRVAPYSYDWLDNFGRRSPGTLIPGLTDLAVGQTVMMIFEIVDFAAYEHITIGLRRKFRWLKFFGDGVASYVVLSESGCESRVLVKLVMRYPRGPVGWLGALVFPWLDLVMMRRQLLNIRNNVEKG